MKHNILAILFSILSIGFVAGHGCLQDTLWVEESFADFQDGEVSASGIDLYVTNNGFIKSVNRYDLNNDGLLDLVFNSGHDLRDGVSPTLYAQLNGREKGAIERLPIDGSKQVLIGDLNNDGYKEAVFLPNDNGVSPRRYLSILWGDESGWTNRRKTRLITISPQALAIANLDGNAWPELIVLNGSRWSPQDGLESVLRIYWGDESSYQQNQFRDVIIGNAIDLVAQDLDNNGYSELIVLLEDPAMLKIFWNPVQSKEALFSNPQEIHLNSPAVGQLAVADVNNNGHADIIVTGGDRQLLGRDPTTGEEQYRYTGVIIIPGIKGAHSWGSQITIEAPPASDLKVADLNGDHRTEIILADRSATRNSVHILWGDKAGRFGKRSPISLPVSYAAAIDVADLDGDSYQDIAVAVHRSSQSYESSSVIFYGDEDGEFNKALHTIPSAGATDIAIVPPTDKGAQKILIANNRSGRYYEDIPSRVYWGSLEGFNAEKVSHYDIRSGYTSAAADLDNDGFVDLVLLSIVHSIKEPHSGIGFNILWGGLDGLNNNRRTVLNEYGLYDVSIADINKDGYLDLLGSVGYQSRDGDMPGIVIRYGGPGRFSADRRERIAVESRPTQHALADFNKDGYLDVALLIGNKHNISILWGSERGLSSEKITKLPFLRGGDINTADLDGDGWLDLVTSSLLIPNSLYYDFGTYIFWGRPQGFDPTHAQRLPGHGSVGITIADWDEDGLPDIFLPSYKYTETRESVAAHLYWGSPKGFFDSLRTDFLQNSGHGAMAGDFNGDGKIDLAISNHRSNGSHYTSSQVFYNQGSRFEIAREQLLPTVGSEFIYSDDVGSQYDRSFQKHYTSSVFHWKESYRKGTISILANCPAKAQIQVSIRSAESRDSLKKNSWVTLGSQSIQNFSVDLADRYMQYKLTFISNNGDHYPEVDKVELALLSD